MIKKTSKKNKFFIPKVDIQISASEMGESVVSEDKKMQKIYEKLIKKYGPVLKKLADN